MARRRIGLAIVLALLAGGALLPLLPAAGGSIRIAGVSVTWWYAIVLAPAATTVISMLLGVFADSRALAIWCAPALIVPLATQVFAAAPTGPLLGSSALAAALLAGWARAPSAAALPRVVGASVLTTVAGLLILANFLVVADVARGLGAERWHGLAVAVSLVLVVLWWPTARWRPSALVVSVALLAVAFVMIAVTTSVTPWRAWSRLASSAALAFTERSDWVREGRALPRSVRLTVPEAQHVTALSSAAWRVVDHDDGGIAMRERQVAPGDELTVRSGDQLLLPAGARLRFEAGRRVPGAPVSGVAWADASAQSPLTAVVAGVATIVTLVGGGVIVLAASKPVMPSLVVRVAAPSLALVVVLVTACWGIYAADIAPELTLAAPPAAAFIGLPSAVTTGQVGLVIVALALVGLAGLVVTSVTGLAERAVGAWRSGKRAPETARMLRVGLVVGPAALAFVPVTPWRVVLIACALALAGLGPAYVRASRRARGVAAVAGALAIGAIVVGSAITSSAVASLLAYPALIAVPLAAAAGWIAGGRRD